MIGEGEDERARWLVPAARVVLVLARDVGPGIPEGTYAPLHGSGFELDGDRARIPDEILDDDSRRLAGAEGADVPLDGLRRLVAEIVRRREEIEHAVAEVLPEEARTRPYPDVEERADAAAWTQDPAVHARPAGIGRDR